MVPLWFAGIGNTFHIDMSLPGSESPVTVDRTALNTCSLWVTMAPVSQEPSLHDWKPNEPSALCFVRVSPVIITGVKIGTSLVPVLDN